MFGFRFKRLGCFGAFDIREGDSYVKGFWARLPVRKVSRIRPVLGPGNLTDEPRVLYVVLDDAVVVRQLPVRPRGSDRVSGLMQPGHVLL